MAGKPSNNYNKPFEYIETCLPGSGGPSSSKIDKQRMNNAGGMSSTCGTKTRQFMIGLSGTGAQNSSGAAHSASIAKRFNIRGSHEIITNPYSLHQTMATPRSGVDLTTNTQN